MDNITVNNPLEYLQVNRGIKTRLNGLYDRLETVRAAAVYSDHALHATSDRRADNKKVDKMSTYAVLLESLTADIKQAEKIHVNMLNIILKIRDPLQQKTLEYYYIDGLSLASIARRTNCSGKTAKRRLDHACMLFNT